MKTITVKVINANTVQFPDGHTVETTSTPNTPPPRDGMCWHDVLCRWVEPDVMEKTFDFEWEVHDGDDTENRLKQYIR